MVPGLRHECRDHPSCRNALWRQQSSYCRKLLQGFGKVAARGDRDRSAPEGPHPLDQRIAQGVMVMTGIILIIIMLPQFVMAALEAAIQPLYATAVWRRVWMAGSAPGHDEWGEVAVL